jgi:16S rRNA (guanine966-N2)-methyltransferase
MADAGRVIAGSARGIRLAAPGTGTRPLADRVKQTLFAVLEPELPGARVLDLFAGSGAAGIEALSRGAARAVFVEKDAGAVRTIRDNLHRTGFEGPAAEVIRADVMTWLRGAGEGSPPHAAGGPRPFDIVVVDPPYAEAELLERALWTLGAQAPRLLAPGALVVAKHFWRDRPSATIGLLASERERRFGETALTFYRRLEGEGRAGETGRKEGE